MKHTPENKIELKVRRVVKRGESRVIRINAEADTVLMELYRATGLPIGHIVSQMIIQGAPFVEIVEEDD